MKRGTMRCRTTSGDFSARNFPAASAASSASGTSAPAAAGQLRDPRHERLVHGAERLGGIVGVLCDLVGDLDQPFEIGAVAELGAQLADESLEIVGDLVHILQRSHQYSFPRPLVTTSSRAARD